MISYVYKVNVIVIPLCLTVVKLRLVCTYCTESKQFRLSLTILIDRTLGLISSIITVAAYDFRVILEVSFLRRS